jgi:hypothetical protein
MIEIVRKKEDWDATLRVMASFDCYHTYDYHQIAKSKNEEAILVKYTEGDQLIAIPFLLRKIGNTAFNDLTSVYGYPGPLVKNLHGPETIPNFKRAFQELLWQHRIISIFSRLNPCIGDQEAILNGLGNIIDLGKVVTIDLSLDLEAQKKKYHKRVRTHVNKARRHCTVKLAETEEEVREYIDLYHATMERVGARPGYFFPDNYFFDLLKSTAFNARILLAVQQESQKIIAGAMFISTKDIVQYHLAGSDTDNMDFYPIKLLIDEMRILATKEGAKYLNLGGGVGNKMDSLFHFKGSFSDVFKDFKVWNYVVNDNVYDEMVQQKQERKCAKLHRECTDFFPCYRCPPSNGQMEREPQLVLSKK